MSRVALIQASIDDIMVGGQQILQRSTCDSILAGAPLGDLGGGLGAGSEHALYPPKSPPLMPTHFWVKSRPLNSTSIASGWQHFHTPLLACWLDLPVALHASCACDR